VNLLRETWGLGMGQVMRGLKLLRALTLMAGFLLGIILTCPQLAQAESTAEDRAMAEVLFRDGKALMNAGNPSAACPKLAESQRLDPGGGTQLLLGLCLEAEGQLASAWVELNEALSMAQRDGNQVREGLARDHIDALLPRLIRIEFVFAAADSLKGLVIMHDGREIPEAAWSTELPLDPGIHRFVFEALGHKSVELEVEVAGEGKVIPVVVPQLERVAEDMKSIPVREVSPDKAAERLPQKLNEEPQVESMRSLGMSTQRVVGYSLGGVGLAALAAGSILGVRAISLNNRVENACPEPSCDQLDLEDDHSASRTSAAWSTVLFGVGLAGVATSIYLLASDSSKAGQARLDVERNKGPIVVAIRLELFDLMATKHGGTLVVGGGF
jgi:hypothetical protein